MKGSYSCPVCHQEIILNELPPKLRRGLRGPVMCPSCSARLALKRSSGYHAQILVAMTALVILGPVLEKYVEAGLDIVLAVWLVILGFELYRAIFPRYRLVPDLGHQTTRDEILGR
ncbi:MAG TPA: hypothetical protein ENK19_09285 [Acidobacteria bacterium]|nr:hypothetical protein [Acidobacteriota bacterium]